MSPAPHSSRARAGWWHPGSRLGDSGVPSAWQGSELCPCPVPRGWTRSRCRRRGQTKQSPAWRRSLTPLSPRLLPFLSPCQTLLTPEPGCSVPEPWKILGMAADTTNRWSLLLIWDREGAWVSCQHPLRVPPCRAPPRCHHGMGTLPGMLEGPHGAPRGGGTTLSPPPGSGVHPGDLIPRILVLPQCQHPLLPARTPAHALLQVLGLKAVEEGTLCELGLCRVTLAGSWSPQLRWLHSKAAPGKNGRVRAISVPFQNSAQSGLGEIGVSGGQTWLHPHPAPLLPGEPLADPTSRVPKFVEQRCSWGTGRWQGWCRGFEG